MLVLVLSVLTSSAQNSCTTVIPCTDITSTTPICIGTGCSDVTSDTYTQNCLDTCEIPTGQNPSTIYVEVGTDIPTLSIKRDIPLSISGLGGQSSNTVGITFAAAVTLSRLTSSVGILPSGTTPFRVRTLEFTGDARFVVPKPEHHSWC
jgi:hypothetical protein